MKTPMLFGFFFNSVLYIFNDDVLESSHQIKKLYFYLGKTPYKQQTLLHTPRSFVKDAGLVFIRLYLCRALHRDSFSPTNVNRFTFCLRGQALTDGLPATNIKRSATSIC